MARCVEGLTNSVAEFAAKKMWRDYCNGVGVELNRKDKALLKRFVESLKIKRTKSSKKTKNKNIRIMERFRDKYYEIGTADRMRFLDAIKKFKLREKNKIFVISNKVKDKLYLKMKSKGFKSIDETILYLFSRNDKYNTSIRKRKAK